MYRITVSASRLTAYSPESGSFSETRQNAVALVPERRPARVLGQERGDLGGGAGGVRTPANYTVEQCLKDWLGTLNTQAATTVTGYQIMARHLIELIGTVKLSELKVRDVDFALSRLAKRFSTRSVRLARMILIQATRNAMVNDLVARNVADLAAVPAGLPGRPSKSLNLEQALAVLDPS